MTAMKSCDLIAFVPNASGIRCHTKYVRSHFKTQISHDGKFLRFARALWPLARTTNIVKVSTSTPVEKTFSFKERKRKEANRVKAFSMNFKMQRAHAEKTLFFAIVIALKISGTFEMNR